MDLLFQPDYSDIRDEFRIGERMAQKYFKKFVELGYWEIMAQGGRHGKTIYKVGRGVRIPRQEEGEKRRPLYNKVFGFKKSNSHLLHTTYSI